MAWDRPFLALTLTLTPSLSVSLTLTLSLTWDRPSDPKPHWSVPRIGAKFEPRTLSNVAYSGDIGEI